MLKFWLRSPLFDTAGDGTGGGGDGAGAANPGAFDPAAFKTELLGEIRKDLNGITKGLKNDFTKLFEGLKPPAAAGAGTGAGTGAGDGAGAGAGDGKVVDPEKNALLLEIKKLRQESGDRIKALEEKNTASETRAQEMERDGAIRDALGKYEFMTPEAKNTAFQIFKSQVQRSDDGTFVAGDLPLDKFIENELPNKHAYLIKGKEVGGANARPGKAGGGKKWDLATVLEPANFSKLTPAEQAEVRQVIASSL